MGDRLENGSLYAAVSLSCF